MRAPADYENSTLDRDGPGLPRDAARINREDLTKNQGTQPRYPPNRGIFRFESFPAHGTPSLCF